MIFKIMSNALVSGNFPKIWKQARVKLIEKPSKLPDNSPAFRPICLLNSYGKLLEKLIDERLNREIEEKGLLSDSQYGFRRGKSTVDAVQAVLRIARNELSQKGKRRNLCLLITLDIKNAFNSANWAEIIKELKVKNVSSYLIRIIQSYLHDREITEEDFEKHDCWGATRIHIGAYTVEPPIQRGSGVTPT